MRRLTFALITLFISISSSFAQTLNCDGPWDDIPLGKEFQRLCEQSTDESASRYPRLGLALQARDDGAAGVKVVAVTAGSEAEAKGLAAGDIITSVNQVPVSTPQEVVDAIAAAYDSGRRAVLLGVFERFVAIPFPDRKNVPVAKAPEPKRTAAVPESVARKEPLPVKSVAPTETSTVWIDLPAAGNYLLKILFGCAVVITLGLAGDAVRARFLASRNDPSKKLQPQPVRSFLGPRDTPKALHAMRLAKAYIDELHAAGPPTPSDLSDRKARLNTLSLASRQLARAEECDPDAVLVAETQSGTEFRLTLNQLKVQLLLIEAATHQAHDLKRALPAAEKAVQLDPNDAAAHFILGSLHFDNHNRAAAVEALTRAVELDPGDMEAAKLLDRAQSMTALEIAGYKAGRAGDKAFTVGTIVWKILKVLFFPVVICVQAYKFMQRHSAGYR